MAPDMWCIHAVHVCSRFGRFPATGVMTSKKATRRVAFGALSGTRTHTERGLSSLPLPKLGYQGFGILSSDFMKFFGGPPGGPRPTV